MVLEMKRALEDLKKGADGAYRKIYDATYEEVYCKSFLITQEEKQALSLVEDFYAGFPGVQRHYLMYPQHHKKHRH